MARAETAQVIKAGKFRRLTWRGEDRVHEDGGQEKRAEQQEEEELHGFELVVMAAGHTGRLT